MSNFDPYEILGLPPGATQAEIKKSYRKQSLILHPDKETGDEKAFMRLTKAYQVSDVTHIFLVLGSIHTEMQHDAKWCALLKIAI